MTLLQLLQTRFSVRNYDKNKLVEREKIDYIMECARLSQTACNNQPYLIYIVESEEYRAKLQHCYARDWFAAAPLYIIVCGDHSHAWKRPTDGKISTDIDTAIVGENICLAAAEQNLGACWICNFDAEKCAKLFDLPENIEPIHLFSIGYAGKDIVVPKKLRKSKNEIIQNI
ncbi:MAG: nitroreductase family protein [Prevotellaceae bacterium]|jgi:nitroreductase|nr:nitroreductase family protein [Prevotellaceae bacterium]